MKGSVTLLMVWSEGGIYEEPNKHWKRDEENFCLDFSVKHKWLNNHMFIIEASFLY